jgi:hypothetical protein
MEADMEAVATQAKLVQQKPGLAIDIEKFG